MRCVTMRALVFWFVVGAGWSTAAQAFCQECDEMCFGRLAGCVSFCAIKRDTGISGDWCTAWTDSEGEEHCYIGGNPCVIRMA